MLDICRAEKAEGRKTLVYSVLHRHARHHVAFEGAAGQEGFKVAVLRASVDARPREEWIAEQLDGASMSSSPNPELVKTGLDLLEFPTIVFMHSGWNIYTLQQAHAVPGASVRSNP